MTIEVTSNEKEVVVPAETKPADMAALNNLEESSEEIKAKPGDEVAAEASEESSEAGEETEEPGELEAKDDQDEKPKKKSKGGFQRRVDKLTDKNRALEEEKEFWRQEALKAQKPQETQPETKTAKAIDTKRPKAEDFETNEAYLDARDEWVRKQALDDFRKLQKEESIKSEFKTKLDTHAERLQAFKEENDDFDEVYEAVADKIPYNAAVQQSIVESDLGPKVMYELAKNPKEFKRICSLPALQAAKEIGKLEARLSKTSENSPVETKTTKAPEPVKPVKNRGTTVVKDLYDDSITQQEWNKRRNEQERARLAGR